MSNLLEKASILTTPTAYDNGKILSVKPAPSLSSELVTNGDFATDSDWTKQTSWSISGGAANYDFLSDAKYIRQTLLSGGFVAGKVYKINFDITSGTAYMNVSSNGGGLISLNTYSVGSYSIQVTASVNGSDLLIYGRNTSGTAFSIDNVSVKEAIDGDFDFTRNSSATRVNSQGLIEDVQILSSNLLQNGDFSQEGAELITNGDFSNGTASWAFTSGATLTALGAKITHTPSAGSIAQLSVLTLGKRYKLTYEITESISGGLKFNSAVNPSMVTTVGVHTKYFEADGTTAVIGRTSATDNDVTITNISVKEVGQDWTLGTGWSIGDDKAIATDAAFGAQLVDDTTLVANKKYKVTFDISDYVKGNVRVGVGNVFSSEVSSNGSFTFIITSSNTNAFKAQTRAGGSGTTLSITNLSVIEITDDTNLPRIDYTDGVGSWLFEPQSTNLVPYSEDLTQGIINRLLITSNTNSSPDGTNTADKLIPNNTNSAYHYFAFSSLTIATNNVYSVFLKKAEYEYALISFETSGLSGSSDKALINLNNGTIEQSDTETKVEDYGNGWYRCSIKATSSRTSVVIYPLASASLGSFTGDNVSGILAWGLQLEQNSYPTSYIPTSGAISTRLQDAAFGAGSSDLINSTEGVLYAEIAALADDGTNRIIGLFKDGDNSNRVNIFYRSGSNRMKFVIRINNTNVFDPSITLSNITNYNKVALSFKENEFKVYINGVKEAEQLSGSIYPINTLDKLNFDQSGGTSPFFGKTKCVAVFKETLTDEELTCLTTI